MIEMPELETRWLRISGPEELSSELKVLAGSATEKIPNTIQKAFLRVSVSKTLYSREPACPV
jgi:hypothetical protein